MRPRRVTTIAYIWTVAAVLVASVLTPMPTALTELGRVRQPATFAAALMLAGLPFVRAALYRALTISATAFVLIGHILAVGLSNIRRPWLTVLLVGALLLGLINSVITDEDLERPWARRDA
jgi:hypothetical protein